MRGPVTLLVGALTCVLALSAALHHPAELRARGREGSFALPMSPTLKRGGGLSRSTMRLHGGSYYEQDAGEDTRSSGGVGGTPRGAGRPEFDFASNNLLREWVPVAITYPGPPMGRTPYSDVSVVGTWDDWKTKVPLAPSAIKEDTSWSVVFRVPPGTHEFKFLVNGRWALASSWSIVSDRVGSNGNHVLEAPMGDSVVRYDVNYGDTPAGEQLARRSKGGAEGQADGLESSAKLVCRARRPSALKVLGETLLGFLQIASVLVCACCMYLWATTVISIIIDAFWGPLVKRSYRSVLR